MLHTYFNIVKRNMVVNLLMLHGTGSILSPRSSFDNKLVMTVHVYELHLCRQRRLRWNDTFILVQMKAVGIPSNFKVISSSADLFFQMMQSMMQWNFLLSTCNWDYTNGFTTFYLSKPLRWYHCNNNAINRQYISG